MKHGWSWLLGLAVPAAAWAGAVECRIEIDRSVLPDDGPQKAIVKVTLDAPRLPARGDRPAVNLGMVLDRSGSMSGSKIAKAKEAAVAALRRLESRDWFSLVIYDHEVDTIVPSQSAGAVEWIEGRIQGIEPRGQTALFSGISQGAAEVRKRLDDRLVHRLLLLSDGLANVGPSSPSDLARLGAALLKEGISVSTVGVGTDFNEDLMVQLAQASDGNHYFVESSADLPRIFAQELGDVLSIVAQQVEVEVTCGDGVRPLRIIGREGVVHGDRVVLRMNQLYGGQTKYGLIEVEISPGRDGSEKDVAVATCRFRDASTRDQRQSVDRASVRFSRDQEEVQESLNPAVEAAYVDNTVAEARDQALTLYNRGDSDQAADVLRKVSTDLQERNKSLAAAPAAYRPAVDALKEEASEFESRSLAPGEIKRMRAGSYNVIQQQKSY
jgi:Ca-activated chloride channel family protein